MAEQAAEENELYLKLQHYFLEFQVSHVFQNMQKKIPYYCLYRKKLLRITGSNVPIV